MSRAFLHIPAACHRTDVDGETCVTHGSVWIGKSIQVGAELIAGASECSKNLQKMCQQFQDVQLMMSSVRCHPFVIPLLSLCQQFQPQA